VRLPGVADRVVIAGPNQRLLFASVQPWGDRAEPTDGIHSFSLLDPAHPKPLGIFGGVIFHDLAVTRDGRWVFAISLPEANPGASHPSGAWVLDFTDPAHPRVADFVAGEFLMVHLSADEGTLYLQSRDLAEGHTQDLLGYAVRNGRVSIACRNPFEQDGRPGRVAVYSMADLPGGRRIVITDSFHRLSVFDVDDACHGRLLVEPEDNEAGWGSRTAVRDDHRVLIGAMGLWEVSMAGNKVSTQRHHEDGTVDVVWNSSRRLGALAYMHDVEIIAEAPTDGVEPIIRVRIPETVFAATLSDAGWLYVGVHGGIRIHRPSIPPSVMSDRGRSATPDH
jgi:hypothetical protein